jgi:hypothetical protein
MNSILKSDCGHPLIEVQYDPDLCDWNEAIQAAYALHGLRPGQCRVICHPKRHADGRRSPTIELLPKELQDHDRIA